MSVEHLDILSGSPLLALLLGLFKEANTKHKTQGEKKGMNKREGKEEKEEEKKRKRRRKAYHHFADLFFNHLEIAFLDNKKEKGEKDSRIKERLSYCFLVLSSYQSPLVQESFSRGP
jgi:hypothetical protein